MLQACLPEVPSISGPDQFCTTATYTLNNLPTGATVTWTASGAISISGSNTANPVAVKKSADWIGTLAATVTTPCGSISLTKNDIQVGNPAYPGFSFNPSLPCASQPYNLTVILPAGTTITSIEGEQGSGYVPLTMVSTNVYRVPPHVYRIRITLQNSCGSTTYERFFTRGDC